MSRRPISFHLHIKIMTLMTFSVEEKCCKYLKSGLSQPWKLRNTDTRILAGSTPGVPPFQRNPFKYRNISTIPPWPNKRHVFETKCFIFFNVFTISLVKVLICETRTYMIFNYKMTHMPLSTEFQILCIQINSVLSHRPIYVDESQ